MRCNPARWILGLPLLALMVALVYQAEHKSIRADLEQRANRALQSADMVWAKANFDVTEGRLEGAAFSQDERARALDIVRRTWGVWRVADATTLVPEADRYVWGAARQNNNIHLTGFVPNERARRRIIQTVRASFPGEAIDDRMQPARGAPAQTIWLNGVTFGLRQLTQLKHGGRVDLDGTGLRVSGEAETVGAYRTISGDFQRRLPSGIKLAQNSVSPPTVIPFTWQVIFKANQIEMSGHVPGGEGRDKAILAAKQAFPKTAIVDKMVAASGAPENWFTAVGLVLRQIALLESAKVSFTGNQVQVIGVALKEATARRVTTELKVGLPKDYALEPRIDFRQPTLPTIAPFTTTMAHDGKTLSLKGYVPNEDAHQRFVSVVQRVFPRRIIVDELKIANGAPQGWLACVSAGANGLAKLDRGRVEVSDQVLNFSGETRDEKVAAALPAEIRAGANRSCKETIQITVKQKPEPKLTWQAAYDGAEVVIEGEVLNSALQAELLAQSSKLFPKAKIVDRMRVKPGNSEKWPKVVRTGLELLARLREGSVRMENQQLVLQGVAPDTAVATAVKARIKRGLAPNYKGEARIEVKSDSMIWAEREAKRKSAEAERLAREKAAAAARTAALAEVQRRAQEAAAKARAAAAEKARQEALERARAEEAARKAAEAEERRLAAEAARAAAEKARKEAEARAAAEKRRKEAEARRANALRCGRELNQAATNGTINFEVGSDRLTGNSRSTLDELIGIWRTCQSARIEIAGHTDSRGAEATNQDLSQRRAQAVRDYFVRHGVAAEKLVAKGYGESQPLVPNTSSRNRARNRRIEFNVQVN